jgi:hypothetical protein
MQPDKSKRGGHKWGPQQRARFIATMQAKRKSNGRVSMSTYAVARKLQGAIRERLRESGELGDVEIYGTLLVRNILKGA